MTISLRNVTLQRVYCTNMFANSVVPLLFRDFEAVRVYRPHLSQGLAHYIIRLKGTFVKGIMHSENEDLSWRFCRIELTNPVRHVPGCISHLEWLSFLRKLRVENGLRRPEQIITEKVDLTMLYITPFMLFWNLLGTICFQRSCASWLSRSINLSEILRV